jgi:endonuclease YncB( thermonuclease family)
MIVALATVTMLAGPTAFASSDANVSTVARIDHVADGDTVALTNGRRVRLVQIDTPEVYFGTECYGPEASATTKRLLPPGTLVRLLVEPRTDRVDRYGRLLRYVIRVRDGLNVNGSRSDRTASLSRWSCILMHHGYTLMHADDRRST